MAYKIIEAKTPYSEYVNRQVVTAVLDSADDLAALGTDYSPGSVAMVADKGVPSFMLNASGEWKEI